MTNESGVVVFIPLTRGQVTVVDWEDYRGVLDGLRVKVTSEGYVRVGRRVASRLITNAPESMLVDHRDGDKLNNRRSNLRVCTYAQNMMNRRRFSRKAPYKGIYSEGSKWKAEIVFGGLKISLGSYSTPMEAATAYDQAAIRLQGEFARVNFPHPEMLAEGQVAA